MIERRQTSDVYGDPANVLVIARSARQLVCAGDAAGYRPFAIDLFGDVDTRAASHDFIQVAMNEDFAFRVRELRSAIDAIRARFGAMPIVWGSGFEAQAHCLAAFAASSTLYGTAPADVFAVNDPRVLARSLAELGVAHPRLSYILPNDESAALVKRRGGCGGLGVRRVRGPALAQATEYFQQELEGEHLSAAFIASRGGVRLLGICAALSQGAHQRLPFLYRGSRAEPSRMASLALKVTSILSLLSERFNLLGLCGLDFIYGPSEQIIAIELNPRPTASFDLLAPPGEVFSAHVAASLGRAFSINAYANVRASMICFALRAVKLAHELNWPSWVADRPQGGTVIDAGMPICTVYASAATAAQTHALLDARCASVLQSIESGRFEQETNQLPQDAAELK